MRRIESLADRMQSVGLNADVVEDPADAWLQLHAAFGDAITVIDRYALEAVHRGVSVADLPADLRTRLADEVLLHKHPTLQYSVGSGRAVRDLIALVPYDTRWPRRFSDWRRRLNRELGAAAVRIEHIGSTAVPGLVAKPIVDIQISVHDVEAEDSYAPAVERAGVPMRLRERGHRYFRPAGQSPRDVHVHVREAGSELEREHLLFRDFLRADSAARDAYAKLKIALSDQFGNDRKAYMDGKTAFIQETLDRARQWGAANRWTLPAVAGGVRSSSELGLSHEASAD